MGTSRVSRPTYWAFVAFAAGACSSHHNAPVLVTSSCKASGGDPVIAAAGDISCPPGTDKTIVTCHQQETSDLLGRCPLDAVLLLGDTQYESGEQPNYKGAFDATWGRFKQLLRPAVGNHEYETPNASGYFTYFGAASHPPMGYYSFDLGQWHLIALNSNSDCTALPCGSGSAQELWLKADLAANSQPCTLAFWHHPRFSSGLHGNDPAVGAFWEDLYQAKADLVLNGHDHHYERFGPQDPNGKPDSENGIREFVVGTGGRSLRSLQSLVANSEKTIVGTFGILKLILHPSGYEYQFVSETGDELDHGTGTCHNK